MDLELLISEDDYKILQNILGNYHYKFYAYGSRTKGEASKYSDIDILCLDTMHPQDFITIRDQLEESDMTISVDLLDITLCDPEFIDKIKKDLIEIK